MELIYLTWVTVAGLLVGCDSAGLEASTLYEGLCVLKVVLFLDQASMSKTHD